MIHKWFNALVIFKENGIYKIHVNTIIAEYGRKWALNHIKNNYKSLSDKRKKYEFVRILKTKYSDKDMCYCIGKIINGVMIRATMNERVLSNDELQILGLT